MSNESKLIRVSGEIYEYLIEQGRKSETFDEILRKLLGLDKKGAKR